MLEVQFEAIAFLKKLSIAILEAQIEYIAFLKKIPITILEADFTFPDFRGSNVCQSWLQTSGKFSHRREGHRHAVHKTKTVCKKPHWARG